MINTYSNKSKTHNVRCTIYYVYFCNTNKL